MLPLHRHFLKRGGIMRKNTIVDEIIKDETGRCVGVAVREDYVFDINSRDNDLTNKTGVRKFYRAEKGIVFGAGGFVNDWRMCSLIDPKITRETEGTNHPGATAGALFTLMRAGAVPVHIDYIQWGPWCSPDDKGIGMGADVCDYIKQYGFAIDPKTGRRCFNELGNCTELTNDIFSLKNEDGSQRFAVLIADSQFVPKVSIERYLTKSLKSGTTKKFETLEELAKFYGLPLEPLKDEMAKYNGWIKEGREFDPDFHRPLTPNEGVLMGKGPWYGHRLTSKLHYTMGGARINEKAEVIGQDFKPIPGLYAAGEITGGVHGVTRLGGNSVLDGIVFGRHRGPEHHGQVTKGIKEKNHEETCCHRLRRPFRRRRLCGRHGHAHHRQAQAGLHDVPPGRLQARPDRKVPHLPRRHQQGELHARQRQGKSARLDPLPPGNGRLQPVPSRACEVPELLPGLSRRRPRLQGALTSG